MFHAEVQSGHRDAQRDWVRLGTLILLRWMAITGQVAAMVAAAFYFHLRLPLELCTLAVAISIIANMVFTLRYPANRRLGADETLLMLLFDLGQLIFLLSVTGGMTNPFALLVLAPVTISAATLDLRRTVFLATVAIALVTLMVFTNIPLQFGDGTTLVLPVLFKFGFWLSTIIGIIFLSVYSRRVATEVRSMSDALFAAQMALSREQKLTDIGGVVAAAAHELGTPLATIKLVSSEMIDELQGQTSLMADARLIMSQADRCRDILRSMGRAGKDDLHLKQAPLIAVVQEAAEPHMARGKVVTIAEPLQAGKQPSVLRRPEVIHGLRNLVQNAVDFAAGRVWVDLGWTDETITIRIVDDGAGFPAQMIGRIGDPFLRFRSTAQQPNFRPDYEGMGLGLFIAKTLLERTGAKLTFSNAADPFLSPNERPERCGAVVEVVWPLAALKAPSGLAVGENQPNPH